MGAPLLRSAPFADVPLLAAYLQIDIDPGNLMATRALQAATDLIQSYTDQRISYQSQETVALDGSGTEIVLLPERPVVAVYQVVEDYHLDTTRALDGPENGSDSEFDFTRNGLLIRRGGVWGTERRSLLVTYSHGYRIESTETEMSDTVSGTVQGTHIAVAGFNADTDTLLTVVDLTTAGHPFVTASADGYGITTATNTTGKSLLVTWEKSIPGLPADIELICVAVAARAFAQDGATQESTGSYNASYAGQPGTLTVDEKRALDKYKPARRS